MRIAVVTWSRRKAGGTETYLSHLVAQLHDLGHELSFLHEVEQPTDREQIPLPAAVVTWCVAELGVEQSLAGLRAWQPDLIFSHGQHDTRLEAQILETAPAVLFAHTYYGTCVSGEKTFKRPVARPCTRRFGLACLLHYYPHRCGGLNPVTMLRLYRTQSNRLVNVHNYNAIVTHSSHMRAEFIRHGCNPDRIHNISYYSERATSEQQQHAETKHSTPTAATSRRDPATKSDSQAPWRLLFLGRMTFLKGGQTLLAALAHAHNLLKRPLHVTFAGDGPDRRKWERQAKRLEAEHEGLTVSFVGWTRGAELDAIFARSDLLVFPSLWPEPFGLIGLEAGHYGIPVAAFAVGGIPDWLFQGVNGYLAPGNPPTAQGLGEAIMKCLQSPEEHARLRQGAVEVAERFSMHNHLYTLLGIFDQVLQQASDQATVPAANRVVVENSTIR